MEFLFPDQVESADKVPEQFRALYTPVEGGTGVKLINDPKIKGAVEGLVGLSKAVRAAREDADKYRKNKVDLTPLASYGEDPTTIATTIQTKLKEMEDQLAKGSEAKINLEKMREDLNKAHSKSLEALEARSKGLQTQLFTLLVENNAKSAIAANKGDIDLLMPFVKERVKVLEENGSVTPYVVDDQGNRRYGGTGKDMTIPELIAEMKGSTKYAKLFESDAPRGGGTPPGASGSPKGSKPNGDLTANQKIAAGLQKNQHEVGGRSK